MCEGVGLRVLQCACAVSPSNHPYTPPNLLECVGPLSQTVWTVSAHPGCISWTEAARNVVARAGAARTRTRAPRRMVLLLCLSALSRPCKKEKGTTQRNCID